MGNSAGKQVPRTGHLNNAPTFLSYGWHLPTFSRKAYKSNITLLSANNNATYTIIKKRPIRIVYDSIMRMALARSPRKFWVGYIFPHVMGRLHFQKDHNFDPFEINAIGGVSRRRTRHRGERRPSWKQRIGERQTGKIER